MLSYFEGPAGERPAARLAMGMAIPREAGGWTIGMAAVSKGRMAREKECERYISDRKCWISKRAEEDWRALGP